MIDLNINYAIYSMLSEEKRSEYDFQCEYGNLEIKDYYNDTPLEERPFGFVKDCMQLMKDGDTAEFINIVFSQGEYAGLMNEPAYKTVLTIKYLANRTLELMKIEDEMLRSTFPAEHAFQIAEIDFTMFNSGFIQTNDLAGGDVTKFEAVRAVPYNECLTTLIYKSKMADLERMIMKSSHR